MTRRIETPDGTMSLKEAAETYELNISTLKKRIDVLGWTHSDACNTPVGKPNPRNWPPLYYFPDGLMPISDAAKLYSVPEWLIKARLHEGLPPTEAVTKGAA